MEHVTESHLHDVGKFMFAFSIFWTYLWFSQFMLIWYANLPEEVVYYQTRWRIMRTLWAANLLINFCAPFLILMTTRCKETTWNFMGSRYNYTWRSLARCIYYGNAGYSRCRLAHWLYRDRNDDRLPWRFLTCNAYRIIKSSSCAKESPDACGEFTSSNLKGNY